MKKTTTHFIHVFIIFLSFLFATQTKAQSGCESLFGFQQTTNALTINFTDSSTSSHTITSWLWDFGDGNTSTSQNPYHTYTHDGTYYVCLTIHDDHGCSNQSCHHITVNPVVTATCNSAFTFHQTAGALTINFTDSSTSSHTITSWLWDFGDGSTSTSQNPSHTYTHDGTYYVCLTIHDDHGCSNQSCHHITVSHVADPCHAAFTFHFDSANNVFSFTNTSTGTSNNTTYSWDFGDGTNSTDENPHHTYNHSGHYTVCLLIHDASTGCSAHVCHTLTFHHSGAHHNHHSALAPQSIIFNQSGAIEKLDEPQYIVNYPNPFNAFTTIQYELTESSHVTLEIYNMLGSRIIQIINEDESEGQHTQIISAENLNTGIYFIKMNVGDESFMQKISVVK